MQTISKSLTRPVKGSLALENLSVLTMILSICFICGHTTFAQNGNGNNWIKTNTVQVPGKKTDADVNSLPVEQKMQTIQYIDGLGRPVQTVSMQSSPTFLDFVQVNVYDRTGRESVKYLPFTFGNDGNFKSTFAPVSSPQYINSPQYKFYQETPLVATSSQPFPYAKTKFEPSPLNRPVEQGAEGAAWQPDISDSHTTKVKYEVNNDYLDNDHKVVKWNYIYPTAESEEKFNPGTGGSIQYYPINELTKVITIDEHNKRTIAYTNKKGQLILKRVEVANGAPDNYTYASTYYIYDDFGNLVVVLPPEATKAILSHD